MVTWKWLPVVSLFLLPPWPHGSKRSVLELIKRSMWFIAMAFHAVVPMLVCGLGHFSLPAERPTRTLPATFSSCWICGSTTFGTLWNTIELLVNHCSPPVGCYPPVVLDRNWQPPVDVRYFFHSLAFEASSGQYQSLRLAIWDDSTWVPALDTRPAS